MTANRPPRAAVAAAALSKNEIIDDPRFSYAGDDNERLLPTIEANQRHLNRILAIAFILLARGTENAPRGFLALKSHETAGIFVRLIEERGGAWVTRGQSFGPITVKISDANGYRSPICTRELADMVIETSCSR